jgi:hypothetical protein
MPYQDMLLQCHLNIILMIISTLNDEHILRCCKSIRTERGQVCDEIQFVKTTTMGIMDIDVNI